MTVAALRSATIALGLFSASVLLAQTRPSISNRSGQQPARTQPQPSRGAQPPRPQPQPPPSATPSPGQPMRKPSELIKRQEGININNRLLEGLSAENSHVVVSITKQRAYLMSGEQIVIDSPISSGKRGHSTPTGHKSVLEKDKNHHSSIYGDYKDSANRTVRGGVSAHIDSAPSGTHFVGAEMKWFMRLTEDGVGMHVGILPGYPASHGCIRMPSQAAELFYNHVKVGTPVDVQP